MAGLRFTDLQSRPMEFLDFTSLTLDEFQQLVPPFETTFHARMAAWRMDGKPRTARRFTVYENCPLRTPEDRLLFILVYLKTYALQVVHGRLFGMVQGKANQWIHVLLPALLAALRALGDAPARSLTALAQRLGVSEADAATVVTPQAEEATPVATTPATAPTSPPGSFSFRTWDCTTGGKRVQGFVPRRALLSRHAPHAPKLCTQVDHHDSTASAPHRGLRRDS